MESPTDKYIFNSRCYKLIFETHQDTLARCLIKIKKGVLRKCLIISVNHLL